MILKSSNKGSNKNGVQKLQNLSDATTKYSILKSKVWHSHSLFFGEGKKEGRR
jgi:hypothetical protein